MPNSLVCTFDINVRSHMHLEYVELMNRGFCVETPPHILGHIKPLYFQLSDPSHLLPSDTHIVLCTNLKLLFSKSSLLFSQSISVHVFCEFFVSNCEPGKKRLFFVESGSAPVSRVSTKKKNTTLLLIRHRIYGSEVKACGGPSLPLC